ncbi:hypothetical protein HPB51_029290 [Rhipicephalus microplus]|uniref:Uncharacterized protein n=1 Tax=Rhipicephalus microplus TaxID=6941 RepID=A0A9J6CUZ6_RHIMP|nr:hypothetical protein HPB51_029290 [Rhipicephalus microplus]
MALPTRLLKMASHNTWQELIEAHRNSQLERLKLTPREGRCSETRVYPRLIEGRADDGDLLLNIHTGLTLHLRKSSILARDFVLTSASGIETHSIILNGSELERDLYHDTEQRSSIIVGERKTAWRWLPMTLTIEAFSLHLQANFWFTDMEKPAVKLQLNRIIQYENDSIAGRNICGPTLYELNNHNTCAADILDALNATVDLKNECGLEGCDLLLQLTSKEERDFIRSQSQELHAKDSSVKTGWLDPGHCQKTLHWRRGCCKHTQATASASRSRHLDTSCPGLAPPPFFIATPDRPPLPRQQCEKMLNEYQGVSGPGEFTPD